MLYELLFTLVSFASIKYISAKLDENIRIHHDKPLWDIVHSNSDGEYWKKYVPLIEMILIVIMVLGTLDIVWTKGAEATLLLSSHCACLHWIRCIAMCVTHVPSPSQAERTLISSNRHDLIVSGHALTTALICVNAAVLYYPLVLATTVMCGLILLSREHYTVDVVLGLALGCL